jgi:chemotaxis protein CheZ
MPAASFPAHRQALLTQLTEACAGGDEQGFDLILDRLLAARESALLAQVQHLSDSLLAALTRFHSEARIATLAVKEVPDAQLRLNHVLRMTEEATHRTLDIVERTMPMAGATARAAADLAATLELRTREEIRQFLAETRGNAEQVRINLSEVVLAQGFQDLTGQILHGVRGLVGEVKAVLQDLAAVAGVNLALAQAGVEQDTTPQGPAIPQVTLNAVNGQDEVDDLIAQLGI